MPMWEDVLGWFAALLDLLFDPERPIALCLNLLIFGLALSASWMALRVRIWMVGAEARDLERIRALSPLTRDSVVSAVEGSRTVLAERVADLQRFKAANHPVDAAALTALSTAAFHNALSSATGIGRSLIVFGLLGTLLGLGTSVTSLATSLPSSAQSVDTVQFLHAILNTLGGMQTAFGTTLTGILGALLVGFMVAFARKGQSSVLTDLERVMSTSLIPLFDTSEASRLFDAARALEGMERRVADDMLRIISAIEQEGRALGDRLEAEFNRIEESFEHRAQELIRSTGEALESTLAIIGTRREGEPSLAEYVRTVRSTVDELHRSVESAGALIPALESHILAAIELQRAGLEQALSAHRDQIASVAQRSAEAARELAEATRQGAEHSAALGDVLTRFSNALQATQESWARIEKMMEELGRSSYEGTQRGLRSVVEALRAEERDASAERERIARHLATFQGSLDQQSERMLEDRRQVLRQMTELVEAMRETLRNAVREVGQQLEQAGASEARAVRLSIEELSRELRGLMDRVPARTAVPGDGVRPGDVGYWPHVSRSRGSDAGGTP